MTAPSATQAFCLTVAAVQAARRPIASLIGKSEKAQGKLAPATWQFKMLQDNLRALRLAEALLGGQADAAAGLAPDDLQATLRALTSMMAKTEPALTKFRPGTAQHSLSRNRLQALRTASALIEAELAQKKDRS
ncbi:MAG: hypothetical protein AB7V22_07660 [Kiritimatiellia bacterium]